MMRFEAQAFSGSMIEAMHDEGNVFGCDGIDAHFLWEELTDEPVHVFICTALPRCIGMCKEEVSIQS
jgi:hypothetical protein